MKEKHPIRKIDPIHGVTPDQLHHQLIYLITTMKEAFGLTDHEKMEAINDTVIGVYRNMCNGHVDKFQYSVFKGYLFISLKNNLRKIQNFKKSNRQEFHNHIKVIDDLNEEDHPTIELQLNENDIQVQLFQEALKKMPPEKQLWLVSLAKGMSAPATAKKYNVSVSRIRLSIDQIRDIINENVVKEKQKIFKVRIHNDLKPKRNVSEETRKKRSNSMKTRWQDEAYRKEILKKRQKVSEETKLKMSVVRTGKKSTQETKLKMSESLKKRWQKDRERMLNTSLKNLKIIT